MNPDTDRDTPPSPPRRGALLAFAALGAGVWWGWPHLAGRGTADLDLEPLADPPGFRRIASGQTSGTPDPFVGLDVPGAPDIADDRLPEAEVRADLCAGLFGGAPPAGVVPIAAFSDYNCPFCRVLTERLAALEAASSGGVRVTWHEWPRLGDTSVAAARAALAADMQGAYAAFHERMMRGRFVATPDYLRILARDIGVDGARLIADMEGEDVTGRLRTTDAIARLFGFVGTPALVVGRTVAMGALPEAVLEALVERERADGPAPVCIA
jgi:predicted DsbA family dithiol-disulfide isomerase